MWAQQLGWPWPAWGVVEPPIAHQAERLGGLIPSGARRRTRAPPLAHVTQRFWRRLAIPRALPMHVAVQCSATTVGVGTRSIQRPFIERMLNVPRSSP